MIRQPTNWREPGGTEDVVLTRFPCTLRRNKRITRHVCNRHTLVFEKFSLISYSAVKFAIVKEMNLLRKSALQASNPMRLDFTKLDGIYNTSQWSFKNKTFPTLYRVKRHLISIYL